MGQNNFNWFKFLFHLMGVIIGLLLGLFIKNFPFIELETKTDFGEVLNFLISLGTLLTAIFIAKNIDRKKKAEEYYFQYLMAEFEIFKEFTKKVNDLVSKNEIPIYEINYALKELFIHLDNLKASISKIDPDNKFSEISVLRVHIRQLCTENSIIPIGENYIRYSDSTLIIDEDIITYQELRIEEIRNNLTTLNQKVFLYIWEIFNK